MIKPEQIMTLKSNQTLNNLATWFHNEPLGFCNGFPVHSILYRLFHFVFVNIHFFHLTFGMSFSDS